MLRCEVEEFNGHAGATQRVGEVRGYGRCKGGKGVIRAGVGAVLCQDAKPGVYGEGWGEGQHSIRVRKVSEQLVHCMTPHHW